MADGQDFAHIKVRTKTSPDEVIYAGVPEEGEETFLQNDAASVPAPVPPAAQDVSQATSQSASPAQSASSTSTHTVRRSDSYRETTMADLQDTKVPLAQKLVIIAAILLIIVALAYYMMVLR